MQQVSLESRMYSSPQNKRNKYCNRNTCTYGQHLCNHEMHKLGTLDILSRYRLFYCILEPHTLGTPISEAQKLH